VSRINLWGEIRGDIPVIVGRKAKEAVAKAAGLAMKRMATKMVMEASKLTRQEYNIKAADAKSGIYYKRKWVKGTIRDIGISIWARKSGISLEYFQARSKAIRYKRLVWKDWRKKKKVTKTYKGTQVSVKIKKAGGREVVGRAFMIPNRNGVFMRRRKRDSYPSRPVTKLTSLSIYQTLQSNADKQKIIREGLIIFRKNWKANFKQLVTRRYRIKMRSQR